MTIWYAPEANIFRTTMMSNFGFTRKTFHFYSDRLGQVLDLDENYYTKVLAWTLLGEL